MKYRIIFVILFSITSLFAQEEELEAFSGDSMKKTHPHFYLGLQGNITSGWNINQTLISQGFSPIADNGLEFTLGLKQTGEQFTFDVEGGFLVNNQQNQNYRTNLYTSVGRIKFGKLLVNKERFHLTAGIQSAFTRNDIELFKKDQVVDLANLDPNNQPTQLRLRNHMLAAGPMIGFGFGKIAKKSIRFYVAYEHGLTRGRWKSDFGPVNNTIEEQGQGRWLFGITL